MLFRSLLFVPSISITLSIYNISNINRIFIRKRHRSFPCNISLLYTNIAYFERVFLFFILFIVFLLWSHIFDTNIFYTLNTLSDRIMSLCFKFTLEIVKLFHTHTCQKRFWQAPLKPFSFICIPTIPKSNAETHRPLGGFSVFCSSLHIKSLFFIY